MIRDRGIKVGWGNRKTLGNNEMEEDGGKITEVGGTGHQKYGNCDLISAKSALRQEIRSNL